MVLTFVLVMLVLAVLGGWGLVLTREQRSKQWMLDRAFVRHSAPGRYFEG